MKKQYMAQISVMTVFDFCLSLALSVLGVLYIFALNGGIAIVNIWVHGLLCALLILGIAVVKRRKRKIQKQLLRVMLLEKSDYEQGVEDAE